MEKAGFILTIAAGLASCVLLTWQQQAGARADWVPGFLCALWSLLMMGRLLVLTAPSRALIAKNHLAARIIHALDRTDEGRRRNLLQHSFGTPYVIFLGLGMLLLGWQVFCAIFSANNYRIEGFTNAVTAFFAAHGQTQTPLSAQVAAFEWGQGFLYFLCLSMMGFLLRSYAALGREVRITLLVLAAYVAAGWITFFGLTLEGVAPNLDASFVGYGPAAALAGEAKTLFDRILLESGIFGIAFMAFIVCIPFGFIGMAGAARRDWVTVMCGTLAGIALVLSIFLALSPALGGFIFLCWMAVFLAWGRSESVLIHKTT